MKFYITGSKKKILFLSCDKMLSREVSNRNRDFYDCASSVSAPSIIENEKYLEFRIFVIDADNDPNGGFNLVNAAYRSLYSDNMDFIILSSLPYETDAQTIANLAPGSVILSKPVTSSELCEKISEISKARNLDCIKDIRTLKKIKDVQLLKESSTNLFNKSSFIAKLNQYIDTNRKPNTYLMIFGIDNLDIFNALYEDDKTTKLINHITSKLSPPLITVSSRYAFDKFAVIVNGDANTCQRVFNEIQIRAASFDTNRYPVIMHAGICEIVPLESDAAILCSHANAAYTLAKYKESDNVLLYDSKTKFQLWNGVESVYNTKLGDVSVPVTNLSDIKSNPKMSTPQPETNIPVRRVETPKQDIPSKDSDDDCDFYDPPINQKEKEPVVQEKEMIFIDNEYPDSVKNEPNLTNQIKASTRDDSENENKSYNPSRIRTSGVDEARLVGNLLGEDNQAEPEIKKTPFVPSKPKPKKVEKDEDDEESSNTSRYSIIDLYRKEKKEKEAKQAEQTVVESTPEPEEAKNEQVQTKPKEQSTFNSKINYLGATLVDAQDKSEKVEKEDTESKPVSENKTASENTQAKPKPINFFGADSYMTKEEAENTRVLSSTAETKTLSIFGKDFEKNIGKKIERKHIEIKSLSMDEFKSKCNDIIKRSNYPKAIFEIHPSCNINDEEGFNEFIYETILDIFGKDAILTNTEGCNYLVLLNENTDEEVVVKSYAEDFIKKTQKQNFGAVTCKVGIGVASADAVACDSAIYMARLSFDRLKKFDRSGFFCQRNVLKGNKENNGTTD